MFNRGHWKQLEDTADGPRVKARDAADRPTYSVAGADEKSFATDFLAGKTVEFIIANKQKPFCYMLSLPDPHGPDTVRPPYNTMFTDQASTPPPTFDKDPDGLPGWAKPEGKFQDMAQYFGMVKCIDDNVGKIVATLKDEGLLDNTIVVFTSDHGDLRGEHHRQNKGVPFEGSAKIPFVIRYPGKIKAGKVIDEALDCTDFLPTILALMDCKTAGEEEGRDASVLFTESEAPDSWRDIAFLRSTGEVSGWVAAVSDRYKLIYTTNDDPWLFDLEEDPDELKNGFTDPANREVVREMSKALAAYGEKFDDPRVAVEKVQTDLTWAIEGNVHPLQQVCRDLSVRCDQTGFQHADDRLHLLPNVRRRLPDACHQVRRPLEYRLTQSGERTTDQRNELGAARLRVADCRIRSNRARWRNGGGYDQNVAGQEGDLTAGPSARQCAGTDVPRSLHPLRSVFQSLPEPRFATDGFRRRARKPLDTLCGG